VTDDATTPSASGGTSPTAGDATTSTATGATFPTGEPPAAPDRGRLDPDARRRRRLIIVGIAAAAVLILLVCASFGAAAAGFGRLAREADRHREGHARAEAACRELERRLNRLAPPGASADPGQRAAAIRDENVAVRPFLSEIERLPDWWHDDDADDDDRPGQRESWRQLVDARTSFADALDRQVTNGEPAFFLAPQDRDGRPVLDRLQRGPESCTAAARRLAAPDL